MCVCSLYTCVCIYVCMDVYICVCVPVYVSVCKCVYIKCSNGGDGDNG